MALVAEDSGSRKLLAAREEEQALVAATSTRKLQQTTVRCRCFCWQVQSYEPKVCALPAASARMLNAARVRCLVAKKQSQLNCTRSDHMLGTSPQSEPKFPNFPVLLQTRATSVAIHAVAARLEHRNLCNALQLTDADILNFALNLEYLEAEYYTYATTGSGIPATLMGTGSAPTTGGMMANLSAPIQVGAWYCAFGCNRGSALQCRTRGF